MARKKNTELERLREEVKKKHAAATAKVARLRKQGIEVSNTSWDIRRDIAKTRRYNMAQLNAYLYELMGFTSRSTQFVSTANGDVVPAQEWRKYKAIERRVNEIGRLHDQSVGGIRMPFEGNMTLAERQAKFHPLARFDRDTPKPYNELNRQARNIKDRKALQKLTRDLAKKLDKNVTIERNVRQTKKNFKKILREMGANDLSSRINKLSIDQADILFNYTRLADIVASGYGDFKEYRAGGKEGHMASVVSDRRADLEEILDWAEKLPTNNSAQQATRKTRKRR